MMAGHDQFQYTELPPKVGGVYTCRMQFPSARTVVLCLILSDISQRIYWGHICGIDAIVGPSNVERATCWTVSSALERNAQ